MITGADEAVGDIIIDAQRVLGDAFIPFVEQVLSAARPANWQADLAERRRQSRNQSALTPKPDGHLDWDTPDLLYALDDYWPLFENTLRSTLPAGMTKWELKRVLRIVENYADLIKQMRHRGAHPIRSSFTSKDLQLLLSLFEQLLGAFGMPVAASKIGNLKRQHSGSALSESAQQALKLKQLFDEIDAARKMPGLYSFLKEELASRPPIYLNRPLELWTKRVSTTSRDINLPIPVAILSRASQINLSAHPAVDVDERDPNARKDHYFEMRAQLAELNRKNADDVLLWNKPVFTLKDIADLGTECTITGSISDYSSFLARHHGMEFELLSSLLRAEGDHRNLQLIKREGFWQSNELRRHIALSVSALTVYRKADGYKIMVQKRSGNTVAFPGLFTVIPGGMFQPELSVELEWNIQHCLIKEYCEELFNAKYPKNATRALDIYYHSDWKPALDLYRALKVKQCQLLHSGVILNLITLDVDICCVILVEDEEWFSLQRQRTNWEYIPRSEIFDADIAAKIEYDFEQVNEQFLAEAQRLDNSVPEHVTARWVPAGLATFWLGIDALREHLEGNRPAARFDNYLGE